MALRVILLVVSSTMGMALVNDPINIFHPLLSGFLLGAFIIVAAELFAQSPRKVGVNRE